VNHIKEKGIAIKNAKDIPAAIRAEHLALASVAYLKAIVILLEQGEGSRGSHLVLSPDGVHIAGTDLRIKPENTELRNSILRVEYDPKQPEMFSCENVTPRPVPDERKAFEPAWKEFRLGKIYE
jgi:hypothetical protein